jgi:uncharacterized protein YbaR (Trm112 family)
MSNSADKGPISERVDPKLLEILVCPLTKAALQYDDKAQELVSRAAGLAYPIRNGVPLMVVEAAREIDEKPPATVLVPKR